MSQWESYEALDVHTLVNILTDEERPPEAHAGAFAAFAKLPPDLRFEKITPVLRSMIQHPDKYDGDVMLSAVELLATDPDPEATEIMLDVLPDVLNAALSSQINLPNEFREYFYEALVTRQRDYDLEIWSDRLPKLESRVLVAAMIDPAAKPLKAIEPMTLISRLPEQERIKALMSLIIGFATRDPDPRRVTRVSEMLAEWAEPHQREQVAETLTERWNRLDPGNDRQHADNIEAALAIIDERPRTAAEKLMGRRPWAS